MQQYVCARIVRMDGIDIGLFDFDRHNALYYFIMNADEQIYMRYGGRDSESASSYLNLRSLELALQEGLEMHGRAEVPQRTRPAPLYPTDIDLLRKRTAMRGECVECHLIADYQNLQRELDGTLDRVRDMYRSPDIKKIGIHLDVPAGLVVKEAEGAVANAGMRAGDQITHLNGTRVRTFGDLQYFYDQVARDAQEVVIDVLRDQVPHSLNVALPRQWWETDLSFRHWTVEPLVYFKTKSLTAERKTELGFPVDGFAAEVIETDRFHDAAKPPLKRGDVVFQVEDALKDDQAGTPDLHIKLRYRSGSKVTIHVWRDGQRFIAELKTERQNFRKVEP